MIGSSHVVHGADPYYPEFFQDRDEEKAYLDYFESILENLDAFMKWTLMDIWIILSAMVRQKTSFILMKISEHSGCDSEKTSRHKCRTEIQHRQLSLRSWRPNPCTDIIRRYKKLGGRNHHHWSFDAHTPDKIGYAFDRAAQGAERMRFKMIQSI